MCLLGMRGNPPVTMNEIKSLPSVEQQLMMFIIVCEFHTTKRNTISICLIISMT